MDEFYNGSKLLSMKDLEGRDPLIRICVGNRTAGKSYYFKRLLLRRYLRKGEQFIILKRNLQELKGTVQGFFKDIAWEFEGVSLIEYTIIKNKILGIKLKRGKAEETCGYIISVKDTEVIKNNSSLFVLVNNLLFDEFQKEDNNYLPNEIENIANILTSVSRGGGKHIREGVCLFMVSNKVSLINPYFLYFDITKRLKPDTKFLRGNGWVLEVCFNDSASKAIKESAIGRVFNGSKYLKYSTENLELLDDDAFIKTNIKDEFTYIATLAYNGKYYKLLYFINLGIYYVGENGEKTCKTILSLHIQDHSDSGTLLITRMPIVKELMRYFEAGRLYFESLECKNCILDFFKYRGA